MAKSERLMQLTTLLRSQKKLQIEEISEICEISVRTAYRYLATLIRMEMPVRFDDGYFISEKHNTHQYEFTPEDISLLLTCLKTSSIGKFKHFRQKIKKTIRVLSAPAHQQVIQNEIPILVSPSLSKSTLTPNMENMLTNFIKAYKNNREISILIKKRRAESGSLIPFALLLEGDGITLCSKNRKGGNDIKVSIKKVLSLKILPGRFNQSDLPR